MSRDQVYKQQKEKINPFEFNQDVAEVFEDMLSRSIPFYDQIHKLILDILSRKYIPNTAIYDLGCSTGTTIALINNFMKELKTTPHFIGIDNSQPMIDKCRANLQKSEVAAKLRCEDLIDSTISEAGCVIMNYTLQFVAPQNRKNLLKKIYQGLKPGGIFILSEKIESQSFDELVTDLYYDFKKRNGYSELEIAQKREALENVLIPCTPKDHIKALQETGFTKTEMVFRWYNFASFLAIKD